METKTKIECQTKKVASLKTYWRVKLNLRLFKFSGQTIIVADPGLRVPFFRYPAKTLGCHWLGRIRNRDFIAWQNAPNDRFRAASLYARAFPKPIRLDVRFNGFADTRLAAFLVLVGKARKGRQ